MSERVSREEQEEMDLIPRSRRNNGNFVAPAPIVRSMSAAESAALQGMTQGALQPSAQQMIQLQEWEGTHTGHVRHNEDPIVNAQASLLYSSAYIVVIAILVGALLVLAGAADTLTMFISLELTFTGIISLFVLAWNRKEGLHHSATGIGHAELKTRERMYGRLAEVEEYRIDANKEVELARLQNQRALAGQYLNYLEGPEK